MPLTRMTISGADDGVDPQALAALSREFPFVEWGILRSKSREGSPRYPSPSWRARLEGLAKGADMALAAHLCGTYARETLAGNPHWVQTAGAEYDRIQLNGFRSTTPLAEHVGRYGVEWILQAPDEPTMDEAAALATALPRNASCRISILWDPSGGRGRESPFLPFAPYGTWLGFAGGITPDNIRERILSLAERRNGYWLDLESGARDPDDVFSLKRARSVLEQADEYVSR